MKIKHIAIYVGIILFLVGCDVFSDKALTTEPFSPKGTISGALIDVATQKPIPGAAVSLSYDLEESDSSITDAKGRFLFKEVPVVMKGQVIEGNNDDLLTNLPYGIYINLSNVPGYRENYYMQLVNLVFESTGGDGPAVNLISNLVLPFGKQNVTVNGKVNDQVSNEPMSNATIELYMDDSLFEVDFVTEVKLAETTTNSNGEFEFPEIEQGVDIYFKVLKNDDIQKVVDFTSNTYELPASADAFNFNVGTLQPPSADNSSAFYITSITPDDNSDLGFNQVRFVVDFNKPLKQTPYINTNIGYGNGTIIDDIKLTETGSKAKRADGSYELNVALNGSRTQLTITPAENLIDGMNYQLDLQNVFQNVVDTLDKSLSFGVDYPFQSIADAGIIPISTGENNANPSTPDITAINVDSLDYSGGNVEYLVEIDETQTPVAYYELFVAEEDEPFELVTSFDKDDYNYFGMIRFNYDAGDLYQTGFNGEPVADAEKEVKIRAVSHNLQRSSFSNTITLRDNKDPDINGIFPTPNTVTIIFTEPLDFNTAFNESNYTVETPNAVGSYNSIPNAVLRVEDFANTANSSQITVVFDPSVYTVTPGDRIMVGRNVTDLAGNNIDDNRRDF